MGLLTLIFFTAALHSLALCWGRQWNVLALLLFIELAWTFLAGGFGLLSLYVSDLTWLYITALISVLSGVELVLSLFAFVTWHRSTGQTFVDPNSTNLK
jgi:hypothetical protein